MKYLTILPLLGLLVTCASPVSPERKETLGEQAADRVETAVGPLELPSPYSTESVTKASEVIDWPAGQTPRAPEGFLVSRYADELQHPRMTYVSPAGEIFVVESNTRNSANRIQRLIDSDSDGTVDKREVFMEDLNQPFGMLVLDGYFYVANTDATWRYPYEAGQAKLDATTGEKILATPPGATTTTGRVTCWPVPTAARSTYRWAPAVTSAKTEWIKKSTGPRSWK